MRIKSRPVGPLVIAAVVCAMLVGLLPSLAQAAPMALPPRPPTPTPEPSTPPKVQPSGALIALEVVFGADWPARELAWQDPWTVVQWQDAYGSWHDVEGWQGNLDKVEKSIGWKTWWLSPQLFGEAPFRWTIYDEWGGALLFTSTPFTLPTNCGQTVTVEAILFP